ncbi:MAG: hypothetical protein M3M94_04570 [Actinomycetota bacterium]|nr:hypothetical protein [Actinomycetota bacterium]
MTLEQLSETRGTDVVDALAFGLGGRDVAARMLEGAYERGQENKDQFRQDLNRGRERGREQVEHARARVRGEI